MEDINNIALNSIRNYSNPAKEINALYQKINQELDKQGKKIDEDKKKEILLKAQTMMKKGDIRGLKSLLANEATPKLEVLNNMVASKTEEKNSDDKILKALLGGGGKSKIDEAV